jgi:hypothetical protein
MDEAELERLERARLASLVAGDVEAARPLHADDYELITPSGRQLTKEAYLDLIASGDFTYETFEPASPVRVRVLGSAAVLRYKARIVVSDAIGATDSGLFWHTDIWELRGDTWQAVWSQATRIKTVDAEA